MSSKNIILLIQTCRSSKSYVQYFSIVDFPHLAKAVRSKILRVCLVGWVNPEIPTSYNHLLFVRSALVGWALPTSYKNSLSAMPSWEAQMGPQKLLHWARTR
jgi:hypothetical protein